MKNQVTITSDDEKTPKIVFSKPEFIPKPTSKEEMSEMLIKDIGLITEGLTIMVQTAHINKFAKRENLIAAIIKTINDGNEEISEGSSTETN